MSAINITEAEFIAVAGAACDAQMANNLETANVLDKLARKINAALSTSRLGSNRVGPGARWQDMPSTLQSVKP